MADNTNAPEVFGLDNLPADAEVQTGQGGNFDPIDDSQNYQIEVSKIELRQNPFWKEGEKDEKGRDKGNYNKYQFNFTYTVLDDTGFRGRKIFDSTSLALKPTTKGGKGEPTKLHKIITKVMGTDFDWDTCASFAPDLKTLYTNLLNNVLGHQLKVSIENVTNNDTKKTRTKVRAYYAIKSELPKYSPDEAEKIFTDPDTGEVVETVSADKDKKKK